MPDYATIDSISSRDPISPFGLAMAYRVLNHVQPDADTMRRLEALEQHGYYSGSVPEPFESFRRLLYTLNPPRIIVAVVRRSFELSHNVGVFDEALNHPARLELRRLWYELQDTPTPLPPERNETVRRLARLAKEELLPNRQFNPEILGVLADALEDEDRIYPALRDGLPHFPGWWLVEGLSK